MDRLGSKPFMLLAMITRGDVSVLVNIPEIGSNPAELPPPAWECETVAVTFRRGDLRVEADNECMSGPCIIGGEEALVQVPWAAVTYMIVPDDGVWMGWSGGVAYVADKPRLGVVQGDGEGRPEQPAAMLSLVK